MDRKGEREVGGNGGPGIAGDHDGWKERERAR